MPNFKEAALILIQFSKKKYLFIVKLNKFIKKYFFTYMTGIILYLFFIASIFTEIIEDNVGQENQLIHIAQGQNYKNSDSDNNPVLKIQKPDSEKYSIHDCVRQWYLNQETLGAYHKKIEKSDKAEKINTSNRQSKKCNIVEYDYSRPSSNIVNFGQSPNVIYPGALVQGKNAKTGNQILKIIPFGEQHKQSYQLYEGNQAPFRADSNSAADIHLSIKKYLRSIKKEQKKQVYYGKSDEINQILQNIPINKRIASQLEIAPSLKQKGLKRNRIYAIMLQKIAVIKPKMSKDQNQNIDVAGTLLRKDLSESVCTQFKKFYWWGKSNIPLYVSQVTYGRLIVLSTLQNQKKVQFYEKLKSNKDNQQMQRQLLSGLFSGVNTRVFCIGFTSQCNLSKLEKSNYQIFFKGQIESGQKIEPLTFTLSDFKNTNLVVSNQFRHQYTACQSD